MRSNVALRTGGVALSAAFLACTLLLGAEPEATTVASAPGVADASPGESTPPYLSDRGPGLPTSVPGVYVQAGEFLVHAFFRYSSDSDFEYLPDDFGFPSPVGEFKGHLHASEGSLLVGYGVNERIALELRASAIRATLERAPEDATGMPDETKESGLGDVQARLTWRLSTESESRPEVHLYEEVLLPHDSGKPLTGTPDFVVHSGVGVVRGYRWGTMTYRGGFLYEPGSDTKIDFGDVAVEYLKRVSPKVSVLGSFLAVQGDEGYLIGQVKWDFSRRAALRIRGQRGVTSPAVDSRVEAGIVLRFP